MSKPRASAATDGVGGFVETRGPEFVAGWAWRAKAGPVTLSFTLDGQVIGECVADGLRPDLAAAGMDDGRAGFAFRLPFRDPPVDPGRIVVTEKLTGATLPEGKQVKAARPPLIRGLVEERGPGLVSGWAKGPAGPIAIDFMLDGERLGGCVADVFRKDLHETGMGDGRAGFRWRLPFLDPPVDVARLEVREAAGAGLIPDSPSVHLQAPKLVRGRVEMRGPDLIAGWARGPDSPVTLLLTQGDEVLGELVADDFRKELSEDGFGDGRAGFHWPIPLRDPPLDPAAIRVVELRHGIEIPDNAGLEAAAPVPVRGLVEERSYRMVSGWAWNGRLGARLKIEIVQNGRVIGRCIADRPRRDLTRSSLDDGRHGFRWSPPRRLKGYDAAQLRVRVQPWGRELDYKAPAARATGLRVAGLRAQSNWVMGRLSHAGKAEPPDAIDLALDGVFQLKVDISALRYDDEGWAELAIELPQTINDGRPHRITLHDHRGGEMIPGQGKALVYQSAFNSMIELVTPHEIRGWVVDPGDPDGEGAVELHDGVGLLRRARFGRDRPEVARALGVRHAWEFVIRRLPLALFDGEPHELLLVCGGHRLAPHKTPRIEVCWTADQSADDEERFGGAVEQIEAGGVKGFAIDYLADRPVAVEILVDGEVVGRTIADRYVAALKGEVGHGFHGFDWRFPAEMMNGRRRRVAVRLAGRSLLLAPKTKSVAFPLTALDERPSVELTPPRFAEPAAAETAPALLSLIILNLNGAHVLEPFLRSVAETCFRDPLELIVIDHGSTDGSREIIEAYRGQLPLSPIYRGANHSFSASCNLGAALARGRHLVMVNNDIVFTGDCLAGMRDLLDASPEAGMVGLRLLEPRYRGEGRWERAAHHTGVRFEAPTPQNKAEPRIYYPVEVEDGGHEGAVLEPAVTAALAMVRKVDFRALGGFDEGYHYGYEDVDFALRLRARLGKVAVCRLGCSAVHNRSATRESKLVAAPVMAEAGQGAARANLDRFIRRFSRHLPRLILRQLAKGGEAWRSAPLRVSFVVGDAEQGADTAAARALGAAMRDRFGWEPMLISEDGHDLAMSDVLVSLRPSYDLRRVTDAAPGLVTVAWAWNGPGAWEDRGAPYQLSWTLPAPAPAAAVAARASLIELLSGGRRRVAIKAQAENEPLARALAQAFEGAGQHVRVDGPKHWALGLAAGDELVVAMAGVRPYAPFAGAVNALCLAPGAEPPTAEALAAFDLVFEPAEAETDAAALLDLHERLRREFLAGLAG